MYKALVIILSILLYACTQQTNQSSAPDAQSERSSADSLKVAVNPLKEAYFGETHLHTGASMDAFIAGTRLLPDDAYRFAKGEEVMVNGSPHKIKRPLDFCAVTDHSEFLGESMTLFDPDDPGYDDPVATQFREASDYEVALKLYDEYVLKVLAGGGSPHPSFFQGEESIKSAWQRNYEATEKHYEPGKFTTIHAYEWTSAPGGGNLHRNVFFRDNNVPEMPFSSNESPDPEKLWEWMQEQWDNGRKVICVPHNSNESKELLFTEKTLSGGPITSEYLKMRQKMEPLLEMMQIKGNSEVYHKFWQADEFADFENAESIQNYNGRVFKKQNFVRYGLTRGLKYRDNMGTNPFKYGFVGGTDSHNGSPSNVEEDNYMVGSHGLADRTAENRATRDMDGEMRVADMSPGALAGVWATSNTREAIWDGMHARETFATSGPRIKVRAFAGNGYKSEYASYEAMVEAGYEQGVPMGGNYEGSGAPQIMVWAMKDPIGPNLDRIQIIKGWVENGEMKDTVYNVAASDNRLKADGTVEPIDAPIDLETGQFNTQKGSAQLMAVWTDPNFDPGQQAYYYTRVLQLPTARWNLYDEIRYGVIFPEDVKKQIVERAWGSPIWYEPN